MFTQEQINDGQQRINGELCRVNWRVIKALREIKTALGSSGVNTDALSQLIDDAEAVAAVVAEIKPPGCNPESPL